MAKIHVEKTMYRLEDIKDTLGPDIVRKLKEESEAQGREQYRPSEQKVSCESLPILDSTNPRHLRSLLPSTADPSRVATLAAIRADEEVPILNAEAPHSAARSPAEIINAASDLEVKQ